MTDRPEPHDLGERIARESSVKFARFWLAECSKIEEMIDDPAARWDILKRALTQVGGS